VVLPDGQLASLGRKDGQVKIRGFRVEPAEVELTIMDSAPGLTEVAVVARDSATLVAFLVGAADLAELRAELRSRLPEHLVPSHFTWLPSLPVAPTGKRDDAALRQLPVGTGTANKPTAPRDRYERTLAGILAELLRVPVGVHDDIFELGATSLTAMRLVVTIEKRYGVYLPLAALVAAPTVAELADRLRAGGASTSFDPLVPIRPLETDQPPLFLVHPIGGNVLCYLPLTRHLPADLPCYALQAAGGEPGTAPLDTVEDLAASYLAAVRRVRPDGPYRLAGWSFGGFVVFEMARQLRRAGATVEVVLLDTVALGDGPRAGAGEDTLLAWFFWELLLPEHGGSAPVEAPAGADPFDLIAEAAARAGILPADSAGGYVRRLFEVFRANWRAALAYRPAVVDQDLTLVRASEPLPVPLESVHGAAGSRHTDPHNGWAERTTGRVEVIDVPGDHLTIMTEPHVRAVAEHLITGRESATRDRNAA
jgi:thioesterase domain-containing protein/acyl carrier protein